MTSLHARVQRLPRIHRDLAAVIADVRGQSSNAPETLWAIDEIQAHISHVLADGNPRFDRDTFDAACGIEG